MIPGRLTPQPSSDPFGLRISSQDGTSFRPLVVGETNVLLWDSRFQAILNGIPEFRENLARVTYQDGGRDVTFSRFTEEGEMLHRSQVLHPIPQDFHDELLRGLSTLRLRQTDPGLSDLERDFCKSFCLPSPESHPEMFRVVRRGWPRKDFCCVLWGLDRCEPGATPTVVIGGRGAAVETTRVVAIDAPVSDQVVEPPISRPSAGSGATALSFDWLKRTGSILLFLLSLLFLLGLLSFFLKGCWGGWDSAVTINNPKSDSYRGRHGTSDLEYKSPSYVGPGTSGQTSGGDVGKSANPNNSAADSLTGKPGSPNPAAIASVQGSQDANAKPGVGGMKSENSVESDSRPDAHHSAGSERLPRAIEKNDANGFGKKQDAPFVFIPKSHKGPTFGVLEFYLASPLEISGPPPCAIVIIGVRYREADSSLSQLRVRGWKADEVVYPPEDNLEFAADFDDSMKAETLIVVSYEVRDRSGAWVAGETSCVFRVTGKVVIIEEIDASPSAVERRKQLIEKADSLRKKLDDLKKGA